MKSKDEIKHEIYELAQKISRASSEKFLTETAKEIHELTVLLKYAADIAAPPVVQTAESTPIAAVEEPAKPEIPNPKQTTIDLFSMGTQPEPARAPQPGPEPVMATPPPVQTPVAEKPAAPKEQKEPKKKITESVAEKMQHNKITDLKAAIGINEKFQFINELFEGNMKEYNCAVDQINSFGGFSEAESYLANLEEMYKWPDDHAVAGHFKELVQRRFA